MHEDVCFVSAAELARKVRGWEPSPIKVVGAFLERIEDRNREIDAYATMLGDGVGEAAVSAERALYSGESSARRTACRSPRWTSPIIRRA